MTPKMVAMLEEAERAPSKGWDGVTARGGRSATASALCRRGFLAYVGHGRDEADEGGEAEVPIYEITEAGRAAWNRREKETR